MKPNIVGMLLALALGACAAWAQSAALEYPLDRVRAKRSEAIAVSPYYVDNRVVLSRVNVASTGPGMQISGEIIVDFECDRAPIESRLPSGPIMGLRLDVQLRDLTPVLARNMRGQVDDIRVDTRRPGPPVEGQFVQCRTDNIKTSPSGTRLATANFELPALPRPLAPGIYQLDATLTFQSQGEQQLAQIKWCSDFWGIEDLGIDPITQERRLYPVLGDAERHERFYQQVIQVERKVDGKLRFYFDDVLVSGNVVLRPQHTATERNPANFAVWDQLAERIEAVEQLESHEEHADKQLERIKTDEAFRAPHLRILQQVNPNATVEDLIKQWEETTAVLKQNARDNLAAAGGKSSAPEKTHRLRAFTARAHVLGRVRAFQENLTRKYWIFLDGNLCYSGWHTVNRPAKAMFDAVKENNQSLDRQIRLEALDAINADPAGEKKYFSDRETSFRYQPPELWAHARAYFAKYPLTTEFDSSNFTKRQGNVVVMDTARWGVYRDKWMAKFIADTDKALAELDTSGRYYNQVWPAALAEAQAARDDVICNAFAYEYHTRTEVVPENVRNLGAAAIDQWKKDQRTAVLEDWNAKDAGNPDRPLLKYIQASQRSPGAVHVQYRARDESIKSMIKLGDFILAYKRAIDAGGTGRPG